MLQKLVSDQKWVIPSSSVKLSDKELSSDGLTSSKNDKRKTGFPKRRKGSALTAPFKQMKHPTLSRLMFARHLRHVDATCQDQRNPLGGFLSCPDPIGVDLPFNLL